MTGFNMKAQVAQLQKKLKRSFGEWGKDAMNVEMFKDDPSLFMAAYLRGEKKSILLGLRSDELLTWHFNQYCHEVLNEGRYPLDQLSLCARYAHASLQFEVAFAEARQGGSVLLDQAIFNFSLNVLVGWKADAGAIGKLLYRGLDTSLLDLRHTDRHEKGLLFRHFWFLMHLYCDADGMALDVSKYSYPQDMKPYADVLRDWRTSDIDKVQAFVSAMADYHVSEARFTAHDEFAEFDMEDYMLFPHEILTFLRLREWAGLPNPSSFEHPLMNQPLARMPGPVSLPQPETPLLDEVIAKFKLEYPGSFTA